ncbi:hypothetical protein [Nonomuraea sp. NPDC003214]
MTGKRAPLGFVVYAALAAQRAGEPAVMCRILDCDPAIRDLHGWLFDREAGHADAAAAAACRTPTPG